jgi:hypothetical protein
MAANTQNRNGKMLLANWFEISDQDYIWYKLQGYNIDANSERVAWRLDDQLHRTDGPAIIRASGEQVWCLNDKFHREDGPAVTFRADGYQAWYLNDKVYTEQKWEIKVAELSAVDSIEKTTILVSD